MPAQGQPPVQVGPMRVRVRLTCLRGAAYTHTAHVLHATTRHTSRQAHGRLETLNAAVASSAHTDMSGRARLRLEFTPPSTPVPGAALAKHLPVVGRIHMLLRTRRLVSL